MLNQLYDKLWLYYNFFQPVTRLEEKVISSQENGRRRIRRRYDQARTPFDRLCATGVLASEIQSRLEALRLATNPRDLRRDIYELIYKLHDLPCAVEGQSQGVYLTLIVSQESGKGEEIPVTLSFGLDTQYSVNRDATTRQRLVVTFRITIVHRSPSTRRRLE